MVLFSGFQSPALSVYSKTLPVLGGRRIAPSLKFVVESANHEPGCIDAARSESADPNASCDRRVISMVMINHSNVRPINSEIGLPINGRLEKSSLLKDLIFFSLFSLANFQ